MGWAGRRHGLHFTEGDVTVPGLYTQELKSVTRLQVLWGTSRVPWRLPGSSCLYAILGVQGGKASSLAQSPSLSCVPDLHRVLEGAVVSCLSLDRGLTPVACMCFWGLWAPGGLSRGAWLPWNLGTQNKICSRRSAGSCKLLLNFQSLTWTSVWPSPPAWSAFPSDFGVSRAVSSVRPPPPSKPSSLSNRKSLVQCPVS